MQRRIDLFDGHHTVTVIGQPDDRHLQVEESTPQSTRLIHQGKCHYTIQLGDKKETIQMAVKGETAYIRAFDRTFTLDIVNPVDQAAQEAGSGSDTACAPMPGMVVEIQVAQGEKITKGHPMMTIESMKILTIITAPRDGEVEQIHFEPGSSFDKNAILVTLVKKEEA